ncbi:type II toxin-antitoxin system RatA family toxin, partial [Kaarinaea lacus]
MVTGKLIDIFDHQVCFMEYNDTAVFDYSPQQVFDVIGDIEKYPEFLPGWVSARVLSKEEEKMTVEQELGVAFLNWRFTSEAVFEPPFHIHITSHKGPFLHIDIDWSFCPVENTRTRVSLVVKTDGDPGPQHRFLHGIISNSAPS